MGGDLLIMLNVELSYIKDTGPMLIVKRVWRNDGAFNGYD